MKIPKKYRPLFKLLGNNHKEVDTVIITGGRYSSKSYTVSTFVSEAALHYEWDILYTRFTNFSIEDSIKKEFITKLDERAITHHFDITQNKAKLKDGNGSVSFKGIKTGSLAQTANLKSLVGFNCLVVDEAEEIPNYETFKKVYYSIRSKTKRNLSILILNPTVKEHWIYKEFFEPNEIQDGFNGIVENVLYIHTSYLDVPQGVIPENIYNDYKRLELKEPEEYRHVVIGGWLDSIEGTLFKRAELIKFKLSEIDRTKAIAKVAYTDVAQGGGDYYCTVYAELIGKVFFITDVLMTQAGSLETIPQTVAMLNDLKPNYYQIETNGAGKVFYDQISVQLRQTATIPLTNSTGKETRILNQAYFIRKHFAFRTDYEIGSGYDVFMKQVLSFNLDKKLNTNDDAPDALSGLCAFALEYYERFLN